MRLVYLNHAATSYPKPPEVLAAVASTLASPPAEPGRGGHGPGITESCRCALAGLFGISRPEAVALLPSATHALNIAIAGLLEGGGHAVTTPFEHTSVLRPLHHLARRSDVELDVVQTSRDGYLDPTALLRAVRRTTRLVVVSHAANSTGAVQPVEAIAEILARTGSALLVDASQSAGSIGLSAGHLPGRVFVAMAGHKGLLGPVGVGALVLPDDELPQTIVGGTGVRSESLDHPSELPLRHEAGTPNQPAIAGLHAGLDVVLARGVAAWGASRSELVHGLRERLATIPNVWLAPLPKNDGRAGIVTFSVAGWTPSGLAAALQSAFGIETRAGLHCAPLAHRFLGRFPDGTVRASFGWSSTDDDGAALADAVSQVAREAEA